MQSCTDQLPKLVDQWTPNVVELQRHADELQWSTDELQRPADQAPKAIDEPAKPIDRPAARAEHALTLRNRRELAAVLRTGVESQLLPVGGHALVVDVLEPHVDGQALPRPVRPATLRR